MSKILSWNQRIGALSAAHPDKSAIVFIPLAGDHRHVSWRELDEATNRIARWMASRGIDENSRVAIGLFNSPEHYFAAIAVWKLGALVLPLAGNAPARERNNMLDTFCPSLVVAGWDDTDRLTCSAAEMMSGSTACDASKLADIIPHPGKAIGSGGSSGQPKVIVYPHPWAFDLERLPPGSSDLGLRPEQVYMVAGPLYFNSSFSLSNRALFADNTLVVLGRFDAAKAVEAIERYRVENFFLAPIHIKRIVDLPGVGERDFSSVKSMFHTGGPCAPWLKRAWMKLFPPAKVLEAYGTTEGNGVTTVRGDEWLERPGTVGRPQGCEMRILDDAGQAVATGEIGEIFMRSQAAGSTFQYLGSPSLRRTHDGFMSMGDMGCVDDDGYLYLVDRRVDLIVTGGANVYPAEVEAVLSERAGVADVAVIGLPDAELDKRVHAIIQPADWSNPPSVLELDKLCRQQLLSYKAPRSYEFVAALPRLSSGKIRRSALADERTSGWTADMITVKAQRVSR